MLPAPPQIRGAVARNQERPKDQDADEIIPGVWIGNWYTALNPAWLKAHKIESVFNCTKTVDFSPLIPHQFRIPVDDNLQPAEIQNMERWAPEIAYKILREFKAGRPMLIHCHAGMQRSTAACSFFLMVLTGRPLIQVMYLIQSRRKVAFQPSANFASAMRAFEQQVQQIRPDT